MSSIKLQNLAATLSLGNRNDVASFVCAGLKIEIYHRSSISLTAGRHCEYNTSDDIFDVLRFLWL